jgi:hypothetical protein
MMTRPGVIGLSGGSQITARWQQRENAQDLAASQEIGALEL